MAKYDFQKYLREYKLEDQDDGSSHLVRVHGGTVVNTLTKEETKVYRQNPHIQQVFANGREFVKHDRFSRKNRVANRDLTPRLPYRRRQGEVKTCDMLMQRGTLLSIIEFMNEFGDKASKVVYTGVPVAADQADFLSFLFPDHEWVFVGLQQARSGKDVENVEVLQVSFTPELAETYQGEATLLIANPDNSPTIDFSREMSRQFQWVQCMRPRAYSCRFSLPYPPPDRSSEFLDGEIFLPIWGPATGTEYGALPSLATNTP
jgi:hypothetical protein